MVNWKQKLTSRKWWLAVAAFVVAVVTMFSDAGTAEKVGALILLASDVISYTFAESLTDAAHTGDRK